MHVVPKFCWQQRMNKLRILNSSITGIGLVLLGSFFTGRATADDAEMDSRSDSTEISETPTATLEERLEVRQRGPIVMPEQAPPQVPVTVTGEVPDRTLSRVGADLATRLNAQAEVLEIIGAEAVVWPDGSLGCPDTRSDLHASTGPGLPDRSAPHGQTVRLSSE